MKNKYVALKLRGNADEIIESIQRLLYEYGTNSTVASIYKMKSA